ncbi:MAG: DNA mismatch repair protein MutS, partial [Spirochaetes bacterium]
SESVRELLEDSVLSDAEGHLDELFIPMKTLGKFLTESLMDDPSILLTEGRLIRAGWDDELDRMRHIRDDGKTMLNEYVSEEKASTGINSLKLKYNRILGYFLEVTKNQSDKVPDRFRRRQSLTQAERFSTNRLEELETEITSVGERIIDREKEIFLGIREEVKKHVPMLLRLASIISDIDVVQSFAHAATEYGYVKPLLSDDTVTSIIGGRHPVVERHLPHGSFVPNSITLSGDDVSFALVTGPNMAGKSTVLRQVALITLMAQAGSFVPADSAHIGIADRIYCRVGASDNLARGESTFLVEMMETANILRNATPRSLVIMDEVGRGTGTADGLAIARAVCEYLLNTVSPRTLFATHYRELTTMIHPGLVNMSMSVKEEGDRIIFPKLLINGPSEASYGIHVGAMAGLPETVVSRAEELMNYHNEEEDISMPVPAARVKDSYTPLLFNPGEMILDSIADIDLNNMTPLEALKLLSGWQEELKDSL